VSRPGRHALVNGLQRAKNESVRVYKAPHSKAGDRTNPVALHPCCARMNSGARGSDPAEKRKPTWLCCVRGWQPPGFSGSRSRKLTERGSLRTAATLWTEGTRRWRYPASIDEVRACVCLLGPGPRPDSGQSSLHARAMRMETKKKSLPSPMFPRGARQLWTSPSRRLTESTSPVMRRSKRRHRVQVGRRNGTEGGTGRNQLDWKRPCADHQKRVSLSYTRTEKRKG
jgi:hypothetical protein